MENQKVNQIDKAVDKAILKAIDNNLQITNKQLDKVASKAISKAVDKAVDRVCEKVEWVGEDPTMSTKLKTAQARKITREIWNETLAFDEAVARELQLDKPSEFTPDAIKIQIKQYIAHLEGFISTQTEEELMDYAELL